MGITIANLGEDILNDDVLTYIFRFLEPMIKIRIERVCKRWNRNSKDSWSDVKIIAPTSFNCYKKMDDNPIHFRALISRCGKYIREMELPYFSDFSEQIITDIVQFCPNLNSLDISAIFVNGSQIQNLANHYGQLTSLTIGATSGNDCDIQLQNLFKRNKNLKYFKIAYNENIAGECLLSLPTTINTLIFNICNIKRHWITQVLKNLSNLRHVELFYHIDSSILFEEILSIINTHCVNLEILGIGGCSLKHTSGLTPIKLKNLQILELICISSVDDEFLNILTLNCQKLNTIYLIDNGNITNVGINYLSRLPHLERLYTKIRYPLLAASFAKISTLKILECYNMYPRLANEDMVRLMKGIPNLEVVKIGNV